MTPPLRTIDLGKTPYAAAYDEQLRQVEQVQAARGTSQPEIGRLLLVEHDPAVITVSRRQGAADHLLASRDTLARMGIELAETDRGGDITYHGPGQLVAYPILDLNTLGLSLHAYMRLLEQVVIDTCRTLGVEGHRDACATGVWVGGESAASGATDLSAGRCARATDASANSQSPSGSAKVCAMGVRVKRWVSMHGLALNVTTNLDHFGLIVPCGLVGRRVTSLRQLLGDRCPTMEAVKTELAARFAAVTAELAAARRNGLSSSTPAQAAAVPSRESV